MPAAVTESDKSLIDSDTSLTESADGTEQAAWNDPPPSILSVHPFPPLTRRSRPRAARAQANEIQPLSPKTNSHDPKSRLELSVIQLDDLGASSSSPSFHKTEKPLHQNPGFSGPLDALHSSENLTGPMTSVPLGVEPGTFANILSSRSSEENQDETKLKDVHGGEKKERMRGRRSGKIRRSAKHRGPSAANGESVRVLQ